MTDQPTAETELDQLRNRLRIAHQARRAKEHQLDDIRRALCDAGFMRDDDPYSHADLADVIRQAAPAEAAEPDTVTGPAWLCQQYAKAIAADDGHPWDTLPADRQENYLDNADAVLRVRDRHLAQLRQRLELADGMRQQNLDSAATAIQRAEHAEAALARVRSLADRWDNALGIDKTYARTLRAALDEPGPAATEAAEPIHCPCDGTHFPSPENCRWCKCHRAWTPPPPGDTREQLPDHILDLIRPYLRGYTSTACQTAGYLAEAIADQPEHQAELVVWRARMKARCRDNQKYTGEICPHHAAPGPA